MNKIFVVDDDPSFLDMMKDVLGTEGYEVEAFNDPFAAIRRLEENGFRCMVVDYHMPQLDGQDFLRLAHTRYPDVPIILCSGFKELKESHCLREGAFGILHKPFDHQALCDTIQRAITIEEEMTPIFLEGLDLRSARDTVTRKLVIKALTKTRFNVTHAAELLGISRQYLIRYMKKYRIGH